MSSIKISEIDAEWLAENVDKKTFLKAVGLLMGKKRSKKSGDGSSVSSKEQPPAVRAHINRTTQIAAMLRTFKKEVEAGDREFDMDEYPKHAHMRVVSYLEDLGTADDVIEAEDMEALEEALNFLVENPEWTREKKPAKKAAPKKSKKALDLSDSESEDEKPAKKAAAKPAKKEEKPKKAAAKALDLSDSESEDEKPKAKPAKAAKPAKEEKPKAAPKALDLSDSEDEKPKPKAAPAAPKVVEAKPKAAEKPKKAAESESESEDEKPKPKAKAKSVKVVKGGGAAAAGGAVRLDDMVKISHDKRGDLFWDQDGDKSLYDASGTRVGRTEDGTECEFA